jgi:ribonuclease HII
MLVCGIDEAGRGPLAGPVTAAAVILPEAAQGTGNPAHTMDRGTADALFAGLGDSKFLSPEERARIAVLIKDYALAWAVGWSWPEEIDRFNIHRATLMAMKRALAGIHPVPDLVMVDGLFVPECGLKAKAVVRGDQKIKAIMAASILAKTERDMWMVAYATIDSRYGFELHKGYPTKAHRAQVKRHGLSRIHRRSFRVSFPE